jgi:small conductance mechanosensitive channel
MHHFLLWYAKRSVKGRRSFGQFLQLFLTLCFLIVLILSTPLSEKTKGDLLGLLGILLTAAVALSSTTFLGNLMSALMIRSLNKFSPGDYLRVDSHFGRITEMGLLHTEIQTEDRDLIVLPNIFIVTNPYKVIHVEGTIISEELSLGYDISRVEIKRVLLLAAEKTGLKDSFVHIQSLGDYSVVYKVAGYMDDLKALISTKSQLRENIFDQMHLAEIEIVSPTFMNQRVFPFQKEFRAQHIPEFKNKKGPLPEDLIFDKAIEAESIQKLKDKLSKIEEKIKIYSSGKDEKGQEIPERSQNEILERLNKQKDLIYKLIDEKS